MKVTYSWITYSLLVFGSGILCDRELERLQAVSCSLNFEEIFYCSNGHCIELSWVCDGRKDCSDGSDETKDLCGLYEYGTNKITHCSRVYLNNNVSIDNGEKLLAAMGPWNVGIYKYTKLFKNPLGYHICEGSIIAPNIVISAADCFELTEVFSKKISVRNGVLKVAVGKYDKLNVSQIDSEITQMINVETIYLKEGYNGGDESHAENIAVIVLANKVKFSNDVEPVCIDWNSNYKVRNGDLGKMTVWGEEVNETTLSSVKLVRYLPFIDPNTCQKMFTTKENIVTFDKFCVDYKLGQGTGSKDVGAGISFLHSNYFYLTGVLSFRDKKINSTLTGFTDIKFHVQWIRGILKQHFTENSCVLPTIEGVLYSYEGSNEILSHGTLINRHLTVIENCEFGYHKAYPYGFRFCQGKGKWLSSSEKLCSKMCPPLESDSLDIKCSHNGKYANCSNLSIPNTIATPLCKPLYTAPNGHEETPIELNCQANGMWSKQLYRCNPYCGKVSIMDHGLIGNGEKRIVETAPWNVGIYQLNKTDSNYDLICGGSIIAPNLVISAAHCFWHKDMLSKRISVTDGFYKVAVGKYNRNFTIIDNEFTQIINMEMIHLKDGYNGPTGFHAEDIAIIVLQNRVSFSNGVSPVCIDWNGKNNVVNGDHGKVVGWGRTEKGVPSTILLEASLPYINQSSCRNMFTGGFEPFVTVDKFCAGSALVSGQGVGKGDSGAGLCFLHSDSYYLTGVVSIKDPSTNNSIAVFTEVKYHIQWIRGLFNSLN